MVHPFLVILVEEALRSAESRALELLHEDLCDCYQKDPRQEMLIFSCENKALLGKDDNGGTDC